MDLEKLQYPIGRFEYGKEYGIAETKIAIEEIKELPAKLEQLVSIISKDQLGQSYRPGGWTGRQIINHLGDVYINAYMRTKWLLTEDNPIIKAYDQNAFSELPDSNYLVNISLNIISNLIKRWLFILSSIPETDYKRKLIHPDIEHPMPLDELIVMYAWHGNHHLAHLEMIRRS